MRPFRLHPLKGEKGNEKREINHKREPVRPNAIVLKINISVDQ